MSIRTSMSWGAFALCAGLSLAPAAAQTAANGMADKPHGFWLTTPNPELTAPAGKAISIPLSLINKTEAPRRAALSLTGLPDGWTYTLRNGGYEVSAAMVAPDETGNLKLDITPPAGTEARTYKLDLKADYGGGSADLPLAVTLAEAKAAGADLKPELPALRGGVKSTFKYKIKLTNKGPEDALFNLQADTPPGFQTDFKKGFGSDEITGLPVAADGSEDITLEVKLDPAVPAGTYPIKVSTLAGDATASTELSLEVTGTPKLALAGPDERLSGTAVAGEEASFPFTLTNSGSAPAKQVKLSATAPTGWTVSFDPATLPEMAAGAQENVTLKIQPAGQAIAGDYMVNLKAGADALSDSSRFRVTVNTSTMWGIAGIGIIGIAVLVLAMAVLRYGRR